MKTTIYSICIIVFCSVIVLFQSCETLVALKKLPTLTTDTISTITQNTAICGGNITADNGLEVTARGICWSLKPNPTIKDTLTKDAAGTGKFKSQLTNLLPDTTYYVRAYATNSDGTAYGLQVTFKTTKAVYPVLTTTKATDISNLSANSGGNVSFNGGSTVNQRGVCWGTNTFPTILENITTDGVGNGNFTSSISGLLAGTTYYIRAYATNKTGTGYGNQDTIKTLSVPTLTTVTALATSQTTATSGGNITNDGGATVTARGICWNTTGNPTTNDTKTSDGTGAGNFTSTLTNLTTDVTYYIRAYATNNIGTNYGNVVSVIPKSFPTNGLVAWYPFNGNANDESGNENNGIANGATLTADRFGNTNSAYYFSSSGCGTRIDATINLISIQTGLSISFWSLRSGFGCLNPRIMEFYYTYDGVGQLQISQFNGNNSVQIVHNVSKGSLSFVNFNIIDDDKWSNYVYTNNGVTATFYQDGVLKGKLLSPGIPILKGSVSFGRMNHPAYDGFKGKLDDIGIWNRALTQEEITNLYNFK